MRIAILGGSFNPLHIGHCMLAETVVKELSYDRVLFVPVYNPPHKEMNTAVSPYDRFSMVEAFCNSSSLNGKQVFYAEPCEIERKGVSYTYDTLKFIIEKYRDTLEGKPAFILGQESAAQFDKWYKADEVASLCDLVIARRHPDNNGVDVSSFENKPTGEYAKDYSGEDLFESDFKNFKYPFTMLSNPVLPISSTEIRSRIANGKAFRYLVPEAVFHYIIEHKLYGYS